METVKNEDQGRADSHPNDNNWVSIGKKFDPKLIKIDRRLNIVIGKTDYDVDYEKKMSDIDSAHDDVDLFAEGLLHLGASPEEIKEMKNPTAAEVVNQLKEVYEMVKANATLEEPRNFLISVYYSGHGLQGKMAAQFLALEKSNILCIDPILESMSKFDHCHVWVIYDACRDKLDP
jgi:hypothetical protein